jgi:ATP-binding cassette subfamily B protein
MIRAFLDFYRPHRRLFILDFSCAILSGLLELAFPMAVAAFVDVLLPSRDFRLIGCAIVGLVLLYAAAAGLNVVVTYWGHVLGIEIETEMRRRAFDHLQKLSFRFFDGQKTGHLIARVTKNLEEIGEVAHHGPEDLFIAVMTLAGAFALMFSVYPPLALITAIAVPIGIGIGMRYGSAMERNWRAQYARIGAFNTRLEENIGGIRAVKAFANEEYERRLFAADNRNYKEAKLEAYKIMAGAITANYLGMRLVQVIVMLAGTLFVVDGGLTVGGFVGFLLLLNVFYRPIEKISAVIETYPKGVAGFRSYTELMATELDVRDAPGAIEAPHFTNEIRFDSISFGYASNRPIIKRLDLTVRKGETIAFVGPSGAGKTTLCALLPRFYDVDEGRIAIDGIDIRNFTLASLRRQIGIVQQDVFLFGGTIRENIAYGKLGASDEEIRAAAQRARLDDMIASLPQGLDTLVGERGVRLSGGQKQRLAIARIFLKDPPILILDEATSALDTATEREIQRSFAELEQGRTSLVIAHRLATIRNADRIIVMTADGIVESGRHDELLVARGVYRALHDA